MGNPVFKTTSKKVELTLEVQPGEVVFREGDLGTEMYIIQEGQVEILGEVKGEEKLMAVLDRGDFFGEMALLEDQPRAATARALTVGKLLPINGSTFDQMLREHPEIAVRMMRKLSRRLRETDELLKTALGTTGSGHASPEIPTPDVTSFQITGPERLVHAPSGMDFPLSRSAETSIGRKDAVTGIYPDIDLTPVDNQRSVSRRHAKIYRRGNKFFLAEEIGTMNATFLNGARLDTGIPAEVKPGDEVRCGTVILRLDVP